MTQPNEPLAADYLTASQAARLIGISYNTLLTLAQAGVIPHARTGRKYVFSRLAIEKWAEGRAR